jgi:hypothetical protein
MWRRVVIGTAVVAAVVAAGAGGFLIGRGQARKPVQAISAATLRADGSRQYQAGEAAGRQAGDQDGYTRGHSAGLASARQITQRVVSNSVNAGYKAAFEGFGSGWTVGDYYVVKIATGPNGLPYELATRIQMDPSSFYDQCPNGSDICTGSSADLTSPPSTPSNPAPVPTVPSIPITPSGPGANSLPPYPVPCADGTLSPSGGHSGACSHHGGEL